MKNNNSIRYFFGHLLRSNLLSNLTMFVKNLTLTSSNSTGSSSFQWLTGDEPKYCGNLGRCLSIESLVESSHSSRWIVFWMKVTVKEYRMNFLGTDSNIVHMHQILSDHPYESWLWLCVFRNVEFARHPLSFTHWMFCKLYILSSYIQIRFRTFFQKKRRRFHLHFLLDAHQRSKLGDLWKFDLRIGGIDPIFNIQSWNLSW